MVQLLLEDVIRAELPSLFPGQSILNVAVFRVSRDSELDLDDEGGRDFLQLIEEELRNRRRSSVVRLEIEAQVERRAAAAAEGPARGRRGRDLPRARDRWTSAR